MSAKSKNPALAIERLEDRAVPSAAGSLDPTFGGTGVVTTPGDRDAVALTPDGKTVVMSAEPGVGVDGPILTRYLEDGQPDPSFHGTGTLDLGFPGGLYDAGQIAVLPDGSIVTVGVSSIPMNATSPGKVILERVAQDGTVVATRAFPLADFLTAPNGTLATEPPTASLTALLAVNPATGDVYLVEERLGDTPTQILVVHRLNKDFDPVGTSAQVSLGTGQPYAPYGAVGISVGGDGAVYVLANSADQPVTLVKFTADLSGVQTAAYDPFPGATFGAAGLTVDSAGRVFAVGTIGPDDTSAPNHDIGVLRLAPDLGLEAHAAVDLAGGNDFAGAVTLDRAGRVVVAGGTTSATTNFLAVVRLDPATLALDPTFNGTGWQTVQITPSGLFSIAGGVAVDAADRIMVVGETALPHGLWMNAVGTARLLGDPTATGLSDLPGGQVGVAYDQTVTVTGAPGPFAFAVTAGALPPGLTLSPDGRLTGTPTAPGTSAFTLTATDPAGTAVSRVYAVTIEAQTPPNEAQTPPGINPGGLFIFPPPASPLGDSGARVAALPSSTASSPAPGPVVVPADVLAHFTDLGANPRVVTADVNGDGTPDYIGASGPGVPNRVQVLDGKTLAVLADFSPFEASFTGGVCVAAADLTGGGTADVIVTADQGGGAVVVVYDGAALAKGQATELARFWGIADPDFRGGARAAVGRVNGVTALVVTAGAGGGPRVAVYDAAAVAAGGTDPARLIPDFYAFEPGYTGGVTVAAGDLGGAADLVFGGGPGAGPRVRVVDLAALVRSGGIPSLDAAPAGVQLADFFAGDPAARGGVRVAVGAVPEGGAAALATQPGAGGPVSVYTPAVLQTSAPTPGQTVDPQNGVFVG